MKNIHILPTDKPTWLHKSLLSGTLRKSSSCIDDMRQSQGMNIYIISNEEIKEGDWVIKKYETKFPESKANEVLQVNKINTNNGYLPNGNYYNFSNYLTVVVYDRPFQGSNDNDISRKSFNSGFKKIILTTDQDLIKDGVHSIPDEFLEWFVKNPNCEEVEINKRIFIPDGTLYDIIIPKEELIKCYCGHTTTCDCIPKEEPKQDFILVKEDCPCTDECMYYLSKQCKHLKEEPKQETLEEFAERLCPNKQVEYDMIIEGAKWQQERSYSEEEVKQIARFGFNAGIRVKLKAVELDFTFEEWFEQFKKK